MAHHSVTQHNKCTTGGTYTIIHKTNKQKLLHGNSSSSTLYGEHYISLQQVAVYVAFEK